MVKTKSLNCLACSLARPVSKALAQTWSAKASALKFSVSTRSPLALKYSKAMLADSKLETSEAELAAEPV